MKRFSFLLPALLLIALLLLGFGGLSHQMGDQASAESLQMMRAAARRAAVECYALEGFYPPEFDYLRAHYGVSPDPSRYFVDYQFIGSNLMPDITVLKVLGEVGTDG